MQIHIVANLQKPTTLLNFCVYRDRMDRKQILVLGTDGDEIFKAGADKTGEKCVTSTVRLDGNI